MSFLNSCILFIIVTLVLHVTTLTTPKNGMVITKSTNFLPGDYQLKDGISVGASNIVIDFKGCQFIGLNFNGVGITIIGQKNVTLLKGVVTVRT